MTDLRVNSFRDCWNMAHYCILGLPTLNFGWFGWARSRKNCPILFTSVGPLSQDGCFRVWKLSLLWGLFSLWRPYLGGTPDSPHKIEKKTEVQMSLHFCVFISNDWGTYNYFWCIFEYLSFSVGWIGLLLTGVHPVNIIPINRKTICAELTQSTTLDRR